MDIDKSNMQSRIPRLKKECSTTTSTARSNGEKKISFSSSKMSMASPRPSSSTKGGFEYSTMKKTKDSPPSLTYAQLQLARLKKKVKEGPKTSTSSPGGVRAEGVGAGSSSCSDSESYHSPVSSESSFHSTVSSENNALPLKASTPATDFSEGCKACHASTILVLDKETVDEDDSKSQLNNSPIPVEDKEVISTTVVFKHGPGVTAEELMDDHATDTVPVSDVVDDVPSDPDVDVVADVDSDVVDDGEDVAADVAADVVASIDDIDPHTAANKIVQQFIGKIRVSRQQVLDAIEKDPPEGIVPEKYLEPYQSPTVNASTILESGDQINNSGIGIIAQSKSKSKKHLMKLDNVLLNNNNGPKVLVKCPYSTSGCKEEFPRGTYEAHEHYQESCPYRPLPCLFSATCDEMLPYHTYMLHLMKHQISPNYTDLSHSLTTKGFLGQEQLTSSVTFTPKWINDFDSHFFLMLHRTQGKKATGQWICWLWMFGEVDQSSKFYYELEIFKGPRKISGKFIVQSVRTRRDKVIETKSGLIFSDKVMKQITGIGDNVMTDFYIDITLGKKKSISKTDPAQKSQIFGPYIAPL